MNDEVQTLIEEENGDDSMIITRESISGKKQILMFEARLKVADKIFFYANIACFVFLTIFNLLKIYD